jgi:hypothetical protein
MPSVYGPEAFGEEPQAFVLSVERKSLHVLQQQRVRQHRVDDVEVSMQGFRPRIAKP